MQLSQLNANEDPDKDNLALNKVIERNIRTIIHLRTKDAKEHSPQSQIADAITSFSGRMVFVYVHIAWFGLCSSARTARARRRNGVPTWIYTLGC